MPLYPYFVPRPPSCDFDGIAQLGERRVEEAVAELSMSEVCSARSTLIGRLRPKLQLHVPYLRPEEAGESFTEEPDGPSVAVIDVPFDDPNGVGTLINPPPVQGQIYFGMRTDNAVMRVQGYYTGESAEAALAALANAISEFQRNIDQAAQYIECFNAALPYLISSSVQRRLSKLPEGELPETDHSDDEDADPPPTLEEIQEVIAELVEEGKLVAVPEIDPKTGEPRTRYYHTKHAPKPN